MTISEWINVSWQILLLIAMIIGTFFGNKQFKNKRAEHYREIAVHAAEEWVAYMDKQDLNNDEKFSQALNGVVKELTAHGFHIGEQRTSDIEKLIEWAVTQLRLAQAQSGINKDNPDVKQNVPAGQVVQPTTPAAGDKLA